MPGFYYKEAPDVDFYVEWSSVVDAPTWWGTREQALARMKQGSDPWLREDAPHHPENRLKRVDETGTSSMWVENAGMRDKYPEDGSWEDNGHIYNQQGWLTRENIFALCHRFDEQGHNVDISDLLEPLEDEVEDE